MTVRRAFSIRRLGRTGHHEIARQTSPTNNTPTGHRFSHDFRQVRLSSAEPPVPSQAETEEVQQGEALQSEEVEATWIHPVQRVLSGSWLVQRQEGASGSASIFDEITAEAAALRPGLPATFADYRQRIQSTTFLGVSISGGVDQEMAVVLQRAERELNFTPGSRNQHGVYQIGGMDTSRLHGLHSWGLAIDINTPTNPYIMHEAGEAQLDRQMAPVYDRIAWFILGRSSVILRQIQQSSGGSREQRIGDMYDRLAEESQAMQTYFRYMQNVAELEQYLSTPEGYERYLLITHTTEPDHSMPPDIEALRRQMMADFAVLTSRPGPEIQPIENERAGASVAPPLTYPEPERLEGRQDRPFDRGGSERTPLRGFLDLEREVVMALTRAGLRWGACELGAESGDIMHFDMALQPLGRAVFQAIRTVKARHRSAARPAQRMTASGGDAVPDVLPAIESDIDAMRGGGAPLDPATRAFMEPRFGHDFSRVRVHTDARAATVARSLDALAFTVGDDIAFALGQYRPGSDEGWALLAHELTHTIQQTGGAARVQRQENVNTGSPSTGNGSSPGSGRRMISYGSRGKDVIDAQQLLNQHGAAPPLAVDGIFRPKTRQATIEFQKSRGLAPDGIIGPLTWGALESGAPEPQPRPPGPQPQPPGPQPVERWTNEDRTMIAAHIQPGVLTAYQASRIELAVMALADGEYTSFRALLQNAGSAMERAFLCKALAAGRSLSDITDFAATIHGMSDNWLLRNLNVVDLNEADGVERGIIQQYGNSCGPTSVQVIRASADPIYALALRSAGPIEQASEHAVSAPDTIPNQMLAGEQRAILDKHAAAGTGNPATDRTQPTGGAWVEGEMNALASATGVTYQTQIVGTEITLDAALDVLRTNLTAGIFVPIVVGGSVGETAHYVMAMAISGNRIQIHDVATGDTIWRTEQEFKDSALNLPSGHRMLTAIDVPTAVPTAQPQPATP